MKFLFLCIVLLGACSLVRAEDAVENVTVCQLATSPTTFVGRRIRIRAIYEYSFELQKLRSPNCCPDEGLAIGVQISDEMDERSKKFFRRLNQGMGVALVVFVGRLDRVSNSSSQLPSGDRLELAADRIEKIEKSAKLPDPNKPVPQWATGCPPSRSN